MKRPRLTDRILRGLHNLAALATDDLRLSRTTHEAVAWVDEMERYRMERTLCRVCGKLHSRRIKHVQSKGEGR